MKETYKALIITISDITGKILIPNSYKVVQNIWFNVSDLLPGKYFLRFNTQNPDGQFDHKLLISK